MNMRMSLMSRGLSASLLTLFTLLVVFCSAIPVYAADQDKAADNWCGTQQIFEQKYAAKYGRAPEACALEGPCDNPSVRDQYPAATGAKIRIRVMVHIISEDDGTNPFTDSVTIMNQIATLNEDYAQVGIEFEGHINQVRSSAWRNLSENEIWSMKNNTAIAPDSFLNVWPTQVDFGYSYGTFPWDSDSQSRQGGIVMGHFHWNGFNSVFSHEVGHCLGLWHTFHGIEEVNTCGSCYEYVGADSATADKLGDFCSDTPPTPLNRNCFDPNGVEECSGLEWGYTMPENYMGYAPESCYEIFTPQQSSRIRCWLKDQLASWAYPFTTEITNTFGPSPHEVNFSAGTFRDVTSWQWQFGDDKTSNEDTVAHLYEVPGVHTVTLQLNSPDGTYQTSFPDTVYIYADTLRIDPYEVTGDGDILVAVSAHNYLPLKNVIIPVTWEGPISMTYLGATTEGLRSSSILPSQLNYSSALKRVALQLNFQSVPPLAPGDGPILNLRFRLTGAHAGDTNTVRFTTWASFVAGMTCSQGAYQPVTENGTIYLAGGSSCCTGPSAGNIDGSPDNQVSLGDLSALIDHLFITLSPVACIEEADVDLSGQPNPGPDAVSLGDLTVLIDHLFISLNPLPPCP